MVETGVSREEKFPTPTLTGAALKPQEELGNSRKKHGPAIQALRAASFGVYFLICCVAIHVSQFLGCPLYFINREWYYMYMSKTKEFFGITIITMTRWWGPTTIRVSGDEEVSKELSKSRDGGIECSFPDRLIMIANHQIYTDWLYLWWVGYTNVPQFHGHLYIILKESLKYIPVIGPGMAFFGFIFMSRKMATDQPRLSHRLQKLKQVHLTPKGQKYRNPMWLLIFPEGTNMSRNAKANSASWAKKKDIPDMEHVVLPRSTGLLFCLRELKGTLDYVYDCTVAYEGVPRGGYGEEMFTLTSTYFQGRPPKSVNFHWRKFKVCDIPLDDTEQFDHWLRERWAEKDKLMEIYIRTGRFPAEGQVHIETEVKTNHSLEILQIFAPLAFGIIMGRWLAQVWAIIKWVLRLPPFRWF